MPCRLWRRWRRRWTRLTEGTKEFFLASQDDELGREKDEVDEGREEVHVSKLGRSMGRQLVHTNQELPGNRPSPSYRGHSAAEELLRGPVHTLQEALVHHGLFFPASRSWIARLLQTLGVSSYKCIHFTPST